MTLAVLLLTATLPAQPPVEPTKGRFRLFVPDESIVFVSMQRMTSTGGERLFDSPDLTLGKKYTYEISVIHEGREVVREVSFEPGAQVELDFRPEFQQVTTAPTRALKPIRREWLPTRVWRA